MQPAHCLPASCPHPRAPSLPPLVFTLHWHSLTSRRQRQRKLRDLALRLRAEGKVYKRGKHKKHKPRRRVQVRPAAADSMPARTCRVAPMHARAAA